MYEIILEMSQLGLYALLHAMEDADMPVRYKTKFYGGI